MFRISLKTQAQVQIRAHDVWNFHSLYTVLNQPPVFFSAASVTVSQVFIISVESISPLALNCIHVH